MKGETDDLPEVTTKGSCSVSDLSISGSRPAFRSRSQSSAPSGRDCYACLNDDMISKR